MQMTWRNIYIYISQDDLNNFFPPVSSFHSRYIKGYHVSFSLTNVTQLPPLDCLVARNWMLRLDSAFDNRIDRGYFGESCIAHRRKIYKSRISLKRIKVRQSEILASNDSLDSRIGTRPPFPSLLFLLFSSPIYRSLFYYTTNRAGEVVARAT